MKKLTDNVGETIYLLGYTVHANCMDATISVFKDKKDVNTYLNKGVVANMGDVSLLHGTMTNAVSIPDKLHDNIDIFLIVPNANSDLDSFVIQCKDLDYLQNVVTALITQTIAECDDTDNLIDDISNMDTQGIDELFVLYGYEVELKYAFDNGGLDDEIVEEAQKIYKKIEAGQD